MSERFEYWSAFDRCDPQSHRQRWSGRLDLTASTAPGRNSWLVQSIDDGCPDLMCEDRPVAQQIGRGSTIGRMRSNASVLVRAVMSVWPPLSSIRPTFGTPHCRGAARRQGGGLRILYPSIRLERPSMLARGGHFLIEGLKGVLRDCGNPITESRATPAPSAEYAKDMGYIRTASVANVGDLADIASTLTATAKSTNGTRRRYPIVSRGLFGFYSCQ